jgi:uracil-DNA glycosylase
MDTISFIDRLASEPAMQNTFNPYATNDPASEVRRGNLLLYLRRMAERRPHSLLIGEAPGYRGCRVTGVPFTSEAILLAEPSPFTLFGEGAGYRACVEHSRPRCEATATILWEMLATLGVLPLLWNVFPYHPHRSGAPDSNRRPTASELAAGRWAVAELIAGYGIETIIAVGNVAAAALARWSIAAQRVRHPGHGGKAAFGRELAAALGCGAGW